MANISMFNSVEKCEKGAWITIKDWDGIETDIKFKVVGVDSKKFKEQVNRLSKMQDGQKLKDIEKLEESSIRTLVAITEDWENVEDADGKAIPFSKDAVDEVYRNSPMISEQVIEFAKQRQNFLD